MPDDLNPGNDKQSDPEKLVEDILSLCNLNMVRLLPLIAALFHHNGDYNDDDANTLIFPVKGQYYHLETSTLVDITVNESCLYVGEFSWESYVRNEIPEGTDQAIWSFFREFTLHLCLLRKLSEFFTPQQRRALEFINAQLIPQVSYPDVMGSVHTIVS